MGYLVDNVVENRTSELKIKRKKLFRMQHRAIKMKNKNSRE